MSKKERFAFIKRVWARFEAALGDAYESKDELNFDWYSDGQQAFICAVQGKPIVITRRVKPL